MSEKNKPLPRSKNCFVCGVENGQGFRLKFFLADDRVFTQVTIPENMVGYDGMAHGGVVATLLDEVMGWAANCHLRGATTTGELTIRYRNAAPVGRELSLEGEVVKSRGRLCYTQGRLFGPDGEVIALGKGKFMGRPDLSPEALSYGLVYERDDARIFEEP